MRLTILASLSVLLLSVFPGVVQAAPLVFDCSVKKATQDGPLDPPVEEFVKMLHFLSYEIAIEGEQLRLTDKVGGQGGKTRHFELLNRGQENFVGAEITKHGLASLVLSTRGYEEYGGEHLAVYSNAVPFEGNRLVPELRPTQVLGRFNTPRVVLRRVVMRS